jgi:hypothetical protein
MKSLTIFLNMTNPEPHPDLLSAQQATKKITRGGMQAIEDKAIAEYMRAYEEVGKEEAEKVFFEQFKKKPCTSKETSAAN